MAHTYNPSYLGGKEWKDWSLKPAQAKSSQDPISTNRWVQWNKPVIPALVGSVNKEDRGQESLGIK
jgi:hypothetical protein